MSGVASDTARVRVQIPSQLRDLAGIGGEFTLEVAAPHTPRQLLDALEARYPMLRGTIRDGGTGRRRPLVRFYAAREDRSEDAMDDPLPEAVVRGDAPFLIVGAIAGG